MQRAKEKYPAENPRIISDNGPQFIAKDFKEFIRLSGMTHVRTSPYYPQSNGKLERFHGTIKTRVHSARHAANRWKMPGGSWRRYVEQYNTVRLHSAIGYVRPGR